MREVKRFYALPSLPCASAKGLQCLSLIVLLTFWVAEPMAGARTGYVALVIGNAEYKSEAKLTNAVSDSRSIADALRRMGFGVVYGENLSYDETLRKITEFFDYTHGNEMKIGVFYYAGHGIQMNSKNYMVPVDADFVAGNIDKSVVSLTDMVRYIDKYSKAGLIFLDACRNNPFGEQIRAGVAKGAVQMTRSIGQVKLPRGLSRAQEPENDERIGVHDLEIGTGLAKIEGGLGMFVAYATGPGSTAADGLDQHSPFTEGLLKFIENGNLHITEIMSRVRAHVASLTHHKQIPWDSSSLMDDVYLQEKVAATVPVNTHGANIQRKTGPSQVPRIPPPHSNPPRQVRMFLP